MGIPKHHLLLLLVLSIFRAQYLEETADRELAVDSVVASKKKQKFENLTTSSTISK